MHILCAAMLIIVGVIHILPLPGVLGPPQLARLYGIAFVEPNIVILVRHRAILFGLLGSYLIAAAFVTELRTAAIIAAYVSAGSFIWLAWAVGGYNGLIARVVIADLVALGCLVIATAAHLLALRS